MTLRCRPGFLTPRLLQPVEPIILDRKSVPVNLPKKSSPADQASGSGIGSAEVDRAVGWLDEQFGLDALWLFGSRARDTARAESDIDLAALFHRRPTAIQLLDARAELAILIGREVDLVDLERASPVLAMQVLRHGRLLLNRDPARSQRVAAALPSRYEDLKIIRREAEQQIRKRAFRGRS